jgi:hypothetical protein
MKKSKKKKPMYFRMARLRQRGGMPKKETE